MPPLQGKYLHLLSPQHNDNTCEKLTKNVTTRYYFRLRVCNKHGKNEH